MFIPILAALNTVQMLVVLILLSINLGVTFSVLHYAAKRQDLTIKKGKPL